MYEKLFELLIRYEMQWTDWRHLDKGRRLLRNSTRSSCRLLDKQEWIERLCLTISTSLNITERHWNQGLVTKFSLVTMSQRQLMDGWNNPSNLTQTGEWETYSLTKIWRRTHQRKQTPTKAMEMHVGGGQMRRKTLSNRCWCINHGGKGNIVEARKMLSLQEDWAHGKRLPTRTGKSLKQKKVELARFAYTTIKALTKEQRESVMGMVMEDKDKEDFWSRELDQCQCLQAYLLNMYK
jgi:hypothetical protein